MASEYAAEIDRIIQAIRGGTKKQISSTYRGVTVTATRNSKTGEITIRVKGLS